MFVAVCVGVAVLVAVGVLVFSQYVETRYATRLLADRPALSIGVGIGLSEWIGASCET